jgi:hypothetical protein
VTAEMEGEMKLNAFEKIALNNLACAWSKNRCEEPMFEQPGACGQSHYECCSGAMIVW